MCLRFGQFLVVSQDHIEQRHCASCMCYSRVAVCATSDAEAEIAVFFLASAVFIVLNGKWLCRNASFHMTAKCHASQELAGLLRHTCPSPRWGNQVSISSCPAGACSSLSPLQCSWGAALKGMKRRHSTQEVMAQATDSSATLRFVIISVASMPILLSSYQEWAVSSHKCARAKKLVEGDVCMQISL